MLIDWFTVLAQAINFLILVWLMKCFLYKPVLHAIAEREKKIAAEIADADKKKADAQKESDEFKQKNTVFDQQRSTLLSKATEEVKAERERLLNEAKKEVATFNQKQQETLRNDELHLRQAIKLKTQQQVFSIARKTLSDLAGIGLEERVVDVFIHRLQELGGKEKDLILSTLRSSSDPLTVCTTFSLLPAQQSVIEAEIKKLFGTNNKISFETAPDLVSGIELNVSGQKIAWNIEDYLNSLENGVTELLKEKTKPEVKTP